MGEKLRQAFDESKASEAATGKGSFAEFGDIVRVNVFGVEQARDSMPATPSGIDAYRKRSRATAHFD